LYSEVEGVDYWRSAPNISHILFDFDDSEVILSETVATQTDSVVNTVGGVNEAGLISHWSTKRVSHALTPHTHTHTHQGHRVHVNRVSRISPANTLKN
jgi:hypothetical protein